MGDASDIFDQENKTSIVADDIPLSIEENDQVGCNQLLQRPAPREPPGAPNALAAPP